MAGLLTYSLFAGLPVYFTVAIQGQKVEMELTAAETVQDLHLIPS